MATNWPPAASYPAWPPPGFMRLEFSSIQAAITFLQSQGWTRANPTAAENRDYFRNVRCDHGDPCSGIMLVSPEGVRYPFAYCTGANHKSALVLWEVGPGCYDLGWGSGEMA